MRHVFPDQIAYRPGYFGSKRLEFTEKYNNQFGIYKWEECWQIHDYALSFDEAVFLYDEAYYVYLSNNPFLVKFITSYSECYDHDPKNIESGVNHDVFARPRHIQDVSIRRALVRLGTWFSDKTDILLQIRGKETNGHVLMPGLVPFHKPELIRENVLEVGPCPQWALNNSVEAFWQKNKIIVRK